MVQWKDRNTVAYHRPWICRWFHIGPKFEFQHTCFWWGTGLVMTNFTCKTYIYIIFKLFRFICAFFAVKNVNLSNNLFSHEESTLVFTNDLEILYISVFIPCLRRQEISCIGKSICTFIKLYKFVWF